MAKPLKTAEIRLAFLHESGQRFLVGITTQQFDKPDSTFILRPDCPHVFCLISIRAFFHPDGLLKHSRLK